MALRRSAVRSRLAPPYRNPGPAMDRGFFVPTPLEIELADLVGTQGYKYKVAHNLALSSRGIYAVGNSTNIKGAQQDWA